MPADSNVKPLRLAAVILAAGGSTRLGQPKQLLHFRGESFVTRAARVTNDVGCSPIVIVTGASAPEVEGVLEPLPFTRTVFNPDWETGMGSSIRAGISALLADGASFDAVLLLVCDQPLVSEALLFHISETYRNSGKKVVASEYNDIWGVPCLFDQDILPELADLGATGGAKSVIERHRRAGDAISIPFPGGVFDVDTPADWERWQECKDNSSP
ncbi:MAG: nucleotidyltransferase family protein [Akkermansiaceae bacterium]|nr:nucleotidyltransferase family protein [Armatimonadota bacterium]